jgi:hypothetical protein
MSWVVVAKDSKHLHFLNEIIITCSNTQPRHLLLNNLITYNSRSDCNLFTSWDVSLILEINFVSQKRNRSISNHVTLSLEFFLQKKCSCHVCEAHRRSWRVTSSIPISLWMCVCFDFCAGINFVGWRREGMLEVQHI